MSQPVVLASASPRRRHLLATLGIAFEVVASDVDEHTTGVLGVNALVRELALRKAQAVAAGRITGQVLGADTAVAIDNHILGKPVDADDAVRMLQTLRGRRHIVATGIAVVDIDSGRVDAEVAESRVTMRRYSDREIVDYVATGEPFDKAGAYAIQGVGGTLVAELDGRRDTVVGLPLDAVARLLRLGTG